MRLLFAIWKQTFARVACVADTSDKPCKVHQTGHTGTYQTSHARYIRLAILVMQGTSDWPSRYYQTSIPRVRTTETAPSLGNLGVLTPRYQ
jgi:hypothetical protein